MFSVVNIRFGLINGTMKGQYAGQPNDYSPNGCKTGIELHDVRVIGIGNNASGTPNFFSRLHTGIASYNSNIRFIRNSEFALISDNTDYNQPVIGGSAVVSIGQQGSPPSEVNLFPVTGGGATIAACRRGVYSSFSTTRVSDVIMTGVETGVYPEQTVPVWGETRVTSCSISASLCGIDFFDNHGCLRMLAEDNRIVISGNKLGVGIRLQEITVANNANYQIMGNWQIDITSAAAGILSNGVNGARISHNNIFQNHNTINFPTLTGISLNGGQGNYLSCNSVHCIDPNYTSTTGLQFSVSTNNRIECNHVQENGTGVFFGGPCGGTVLRGNIMQDNSLGLWLNGSATIGVQSHHGNKWMGTFSSGFGADNWNSTLPGLTNSKFEVTTAMSTILHPNVPLYDISTQYGGTAPVDWFNLDPLGNTFNNCASQICNSALTGGNEDRFYERSIASDSIETLDYKPESRNMAQQYLFEALNKDDSLLNSDTVFTSFYNDKQTENIGKLYELKEIMKAAFEMDEADAAACKTLDSLISIKTDSIALIDSLYFISNDTSLFTLRASIIDALNDLQTASAQIISDYHSVKSALLDTAYQLNNYIIPEELPEENQQFGNFIYLLYDKFGKDTLLHYYQQIFDVASQCPYAGGPAVYALRAFVSLLNDSVEYNDAAVCQSAGYYRKQPDRNFISKSESAFQLIPNPADEQVEIKTTFLTVGICTVQLTDLAGKTLFETSFDCKKQSYLLTTKWLAPGTYFVKLKVDEAKAETKKLVIIR